MGEATDKHMGTKFLALFAGFVLALIYTLLRFFSTATLTLTDLYSIAIVWAFFTIVIPLIMFLAEILWRYAHHYSNKIPFQLSDTMRAVRML